MPCHVRTFRWLPLVAACTVTIPVTAQRVFTAADYAKATQAMNAPAEVVRLAQAGNVEPNWLPNNQMWYRTSEGQFLLVDPVKKTKLPAFDHAKVAAAFSAAVHRTVGATTLPFTRIAFTKDNKSIMVADSGKEWSCDVKGSKCTALAAGSIPQAAAVEGGGGRGGRAGGGGGGRGGAGGGGNTSSDGKPLNMSPDASRGIFIRDGNLFVKEMAGGTETQLTTDAQKDFGYATNNAGWTGGAPWGGNNAIGLWSPDSKKFATQQQDERGVGMMYLVSTPTGGTFSTREGGHPLLKAWPYPLPGDSIITTIQRVIVDVAARKVIRLQMGVDQHRGSVTDNLNMGDLKWRPDGSELVFLSSSRDHKKVTLRSANSTTGAVREVMSETSATQFESAPSGGILWRMNWPTNEVVWYSERDNWGHIYMYDLATGQLKSKVTPGDGVTTAISRINDTTRTMWFTAVGREPGQNPYYAHYYRVKLDGTGMTSLTPDDGTHDAPKYSPDGKYLVDTWSKTDVPPQSALRDATTGALIMPLEKGADPAALRAAGWNPVTTIKMKGRDGTTDVYGVMFKPAVIEAGKKYPIINNIYPGPQSGSNGAWGWTPSGGDASALASLGFVVVKINGMGTPNRDKKFHDAYYGKMGDNTLPDQVSGMRELAQKNSFIDIDKAGIWGHSGGGFAGAGGMFRYPDFFKVGIAESGNHDNREYEDDWGERYQGLETKNADGTDSYTAESNQFVAKNLKGHLMLVHGTLDNNVPPYNTLLVVDALIKANKDFDLVLIPNSGHGYGGVAGTYIERRRWDYFVKYLMGGEPPKEFDLGAAQAAGGGGRGGRGGRAGGPPPAGGGGGK